MISLKAAYALLGLKPGCTLLSVRMEYIGRARQLHPDRGGDPVKFAELSEAYREVMAHVSARKEPCGACGGSGRQRIGKGFHRTEIVCSKCDGEGVI